MDALPQAVGTSTWWWGRWALFYYCSGARSKSFHFEPFLWVQTILDTLATCFYCYHSQ
jgi:hypothetical protein